MLYNICIFLVKILYLPLLRLDIKGKENIKNLNGAILYSNHLSMNDIVILQCITKQKLKIIAKEELFKNKFMAYCLKALGAFPTSRGKADFSALSTAKDEINKGGTFMIFPEGTRSKTGKLGRFMPGLASVALDTNAELVMAVFRSKPKLFKKTEIEFFKKKKISDYVLSDEKNMRNIKALTDALRAEMAEKLGE